MRQDSGELFERGTAVARIHGEVFETLPRDLYIPPDALTLFLASFEGPFDLLLYLIRRQRLDLTEISVAQVTDQYMAYVEEIRNHNMELASDYLAMAAELAAIKSRLLLPRPENASPEDDPTARILEEVAAYEKIRLAAKVLAGLPKLGTDFWMPQVALESEVEPPKVLPEELARVYLSLSKREGLLVNHKIDSQELSIHEMMSAIVKELETKPYLNLQDFMAGLGPLKAQVAAFLAVLELVREGLLDVIQAEPFAPVYLVRG